MSQQDAFQQSVTVWIHRLKQGHEDAAQQIWDRFFERLVRVAGNRMGAAERRVADEEDVAVSVFESLWKGAQQGRFDRLQNRDDLWKLLVAITGMKAVDQIRRQMSQKRGGGQVRGDSVVAGGDHQRPASFEQFMSEEPDPEFLAIMDEQQEALFSELRDDLLRTIASLRLQGYDNREIADQTGISIRSVERKVSLIRDAWMHRLEKSGEEK